MAFLFSFVITNLEDRWSEESDPNQASDSQP